MLASSGVGAALYMFTLLATVVVEGGLPKRLQRRRFARMIDHLRDHFIICGYGRIGSIVAQQFHRQKVPYVVIERDPVRLQAAMDLGALALEADASREDVLKRVARHRRSGTITPADLPAECWTVSRRLLSPLESMERDAIVQALLDLHGNKVKTAESLGMSRATIYRKIHEYGIVTPSS